MTSYVAQCYAMQTVCIHSELNYIPYIPPKQLFYAHVCRLVLKQKVITVLRHMTLTIKSRCDLAVMAGEIFHAGSG